MQKSPSYDRMRERRRGSVYVAVLGVAMIASMIALCAMQLARLDRRAAAARNALGDARLLAQSGVEFAMARIALDPNWRDNYANGGEEPSSGIKLGNGKVSFRLTDVDGDLADDPNDPVQIEGIGRADGVVFVYSATAISCVDGDVHLDPGTWHRAAKQ